METARLLSAASLLISLSMAVSVIPIANAAWVMEYDRELSATIFENGFINPTSLSLDAASNELCVTDRGALSIRILNAGGIATFNTSSQGRLSLPMDTVLDSRGGFIFTDSDTHLGRTIKRLNYLGEPIPFTPEEPGGNWQPERLLLTRDDHIITIDTQQALICKHELNTGDLVWRRKLTEAEDEIRDLISGRPSEGPDGSIYIPVSNMHQVWIYSPDGEPKGGFGVFGSTEGHMVFPSEVGFGQEQTLLVMDRMRNKVLLFDPQLTFLEEFGSYGLSPGQIYHPHALVTSNQGVIFISQGFQGRIQAFRLRNTKSSPTALLEPDRDSKPGLSLVAATPTPRLRANPKGGSQQPFSRVTRSALTNSITTAFLDLSLNVTR